MNRVISYIDGFNFYFGLRAKGWQKYYWLDLAAMTRSFLKPGQQFVHCHYFTARIRQRPNGQSAKTPIPVAGRAGHAAGYYLPLWPLSAQGSGMPKLWRHLDQP